MSTHQPLSLRDWLLSLLRPRIRPVPQPPNPPVEPPRPVSPQPPPSPGALGLIAARGDMLRLHNDARAAVGCLPLSLDERLNAAAQWQAYDVAWRGGTIVNMHTGSDGSDVGDRAIRAGYRWGGIAENAAPGLPAGGGWSSSGDRFTPAMAMEAWQQSSGHWSNILNPQWQHLGVGRGAAVDGTMVWICVFGRPA